MTHDTCDLLKRKINKTCEAIYLWLSHNYIISLLLKTHIITFIRIYNKVVTENRFGKWFKMKRIELTCYLFYLLITTISCHQVGNLEPYKY